MMEFIISRWAMGVCGLLLLSAIGSGIALLQDEGREDISWEVYQRINGAMEDAMGLGMEMRVSMDDALPSPSWSVTLTPTWMTVSDGRGEWSYPLSAVMGVEGSIVLTAGDVLRIGADGSLGAQPENADTSSPTASTNLSHSSRVL